jgi:hypothetical protein
MPRLPESEGLRYLRQAQLRALETYWYLRLVEGTPHVFELYQRYYACYLWYAWFSTRCCR